MPIDAEAFSEIRWLKNLEWLTVFHSSISTAASACLKELPNLRELWWPSSAVTLDNVQDFAEIPNLELLDIIGDPLPRVIVNALWTALPQCKLETE